MRDETRIASVSDGTARAKRPGKTRRIDEVRLENQPAYRSENRLKRDLVSATRNICRRTISDPDQSSLPRQAIALMMSSTIFLASASNIMVLSI